MIPLVARGIASLAGRLIARNPRLGKKIFDLVKRPKGITVYRGEPWKTRSTLDQMAKLMYGPGKGGQHNNPLRFGATGRWFTQDPKGARLFAGFTGPLGPFPGRIKKVILSPKEVKIAERLSKKLHNVEDRGQRGYGLVVPRRALPRVETDYLQTFLTNFYKSIGKRGLKDGGLAQILNV